MASTAARQNERMDGGMVAPLTWHTALTTWRLAWVPDLLVAIAAAIYLAGVIRARRRGGWPWWRTGSFMAGLAVLVVGVNGSLAVYSDVLFWVHMILHLVLIMVVPLLVIAGHPLALWQAADAPRLAGRLPRRADGAVRWAAGAATFPLVALALYAAVLVGTHLTGFMQVMMTHTWVDHAEHVLYLGAGYLYFVTLIGSEPVRWRVSYPVRLFLLFLGMGVDTLVGLILIQTPTEPWPAYAAIHRTWGPGLVEDVHWGGAVMWIGGDGLMVVVILLVMFGWLASPAGAKAGPGNWLEGVRRAALAGGGHGHGDVEPSGAPLAASADVDEDSAALDAYNSMLARMARGGAEADGEPR
jgi:cytochrome c oxidase assembly factor CtaG